MSTVKNPWDTLASTTFNTNIAPQDIDSNAADNIIISWPVIIDCLERHVARIPGSRALDFGCGAGSFTKKLHGLGFTAVGVDSAAGMIDNARELHVRVAEFKVGDDDLVPSLGKFTVITSLMTMQFIEDAPKAISNLAKALEPGGIFVFSVFSKEYARNAFRAGLEFFDFDFSTNPAKGYFELFDDDKVPTFIRDADYYRKIADGAGLTPVLEAYPPFTEEFLRDYPHPVPTIDPEYMILGFKKAA